MELQPVVAIPLFNYWSFVPNILHIFVPVDKNGVRHRNIHRQRLDAHFHRMHSAFGQSLQAAKGHPVNTLQTIVYN